MDKMKPGEQRPLTRREIDRHLKDIDVAIEAAFQLLIGAGAEGIVISACKTTQTEPVARTRLFRASGSTLSPLIIARVCIMALREVAMGAPLPTEKPNDATKH